MTNFWKKEIQLKDWCNFRIDFWIFFSKMKKIKFLWKKLTFYIQFIYFFNCNVSSDLFKSSIKAVFGEKSKILMFNLQNCHWNSFAWIKIEFRKIWKKIEFGKNRKEEKNVLGIEILVGIANWIFFDLKIKIPDLRIHSKSEEFLK